jgi:hypothetical protein
MNEIVSSFLLTAVVLADLGMVYVYVKAYKYFENFQKIKRATKLGGKK